MRSICMVFTLFPSWKTEMLLLPEFTASARLLAESTARAPGILTVMAVVEPDGVKLAVPVPFCPGPVETMASRCQAVGSSKDTWLSFGLKETAVFVKGWKTTAVGPSSGVPGLNERGIQL